MNFDAHTVGYIAGVLTTIAFVPQLILTLRTRDTASLSLGMYSAFTLGVGLWLTYGILLEDNALIYSNGLTFSMAAIILLIKVTNVVNKKER